MADSLRTQLRAPYGPVNMADLDPGATAPGPGDKAAAKAALLDDGQRLADLQELLYAEGVTGGNRRMLLVLQGMDTSGKGGTISRVVGAVNPQGVAITSFKKPTPEERQHHFLWRIRRAVPGAGLIGVFDRSHYEDVLVARVRQLADPNVIEQRYEEIVDFERELVAGGVTVVKCFLHISAREQKRRLVARLDNPRKRWKYNPDDVDERALRKQYQNAYRMVLERTNTDEAPWFAVPSDHKWYRNWVVGRLLLETLEELDPRMPEPAFDVVAERQRLVAVPDDV